MESGNQFTNSWKEGFSDSVGAGRQLASIITTIKRDEVNSAILSHDSVQLQPGPFSATTTELARAMILTSIRNESGKPIFQLNGKVFYPVIYMCTWPEATPEKVNQLLADGFNMLIIGIDASDAESKNPNLIATINWLQRQKIPVIVDLLHSPIWEELKESEKESWNMQLANGERVKYFPDYANPAVRNEFLNRLGNVVDFLKPYYGDPVVAFHIGVTDSLHIPDGEVHYAFKVEEPEGDATSLPYGPYALEEYKKFIQRNGYSVQDVGFQSISEIQLPTSLKLAKNNLHWQSWILYRRAYIHDFVKSLSDMVKSKSQLPVTAMLDINFSRIEKYACPLFAFDDSLDFVGVYYYGLADKSKYRIPELMAYAYQHFAVQGKPLISLLELSSALGKVPTPSSDYIRYSLPYVSGFCTMNFLFGGLDKKMLAWQYSGFEKTLQELKKTNELFSTTSPAKIALLLSTSDIEALDNLGLPIILGNLRIPFDIVYDIDVIQNKISLAQYDLVYIPSGQPNMIRQKTMQTILENYQQTNGICIRDGEGQKLWSQIENRHNFVHSEDKVIIKSASQLLSVLNSLWDKTVKRTQGVLFFSKDFNGWDNTLGSDVTIESDRKINVNKTNKNMKGIKLNKLLSPPFVSEFTLTAHSGESRISFISKTNDEISLGQDKRGWIGIFINGAWIPFLKATLEKSYTYVVGVTPVQDKGIIAVLIFDAHRKKISENWFIVDKLYNDYWMQLFWAYDNANGTIQDISVENNINFPNTFRIEVK
ncbi:MAG: hypothetical protein ACE14V_03170 [bacterium]